MKFPPFFVLSNIATRIVLALLITEIKVLQNLFKNCFKFYKKYGSVYKVYVGNELKIFIAKPEVAETIFSSNVNITKSNAYDLLKPWLGIGLLISTGSKWKSRRKMITPTFHFKILDEFIEIFNSAGNILVDKLSKEVGKQSVDMYKYINVFSLDIICETSMGVKIKAQEDENTEYVRAVRSYLNIFTVRMFSAWQRFDLLFKLSSKYSEYKRVLKILHTFSNDIIIKRREEKSKHKSNFISSDDGIKRKVALLDMLLESENNNMLTNEDIREEIDTFMFEGHDTTTSGICFTILSLSNNPDVQEKVYEEIVSVIGNEKNSIITMKNLQEINYLDMVIKESQRYYPTVPIIERKLEEDLSIDGYNLPKNSICTLYIYGLHQSKEHFPNPEKFDPDRFLPENQSPRHNYAYVPFSAGPRNCVGQKFAILEMKSAIINIVRNFKILPVPNFKPDLGMAAILKSYNGIQVQLQHRHEI